MGFDTSNTYPFGFPYPTLPASTLDNHGGITGLQLTVGADDVNMKPADTYVYTATLEHTPLKNLAAGVGYIGQQSVNLVTGSAQTTATSYGVDINRFNGDLIQCNCSVPTRLNSSFGSITHATNGASSEYNGVYVALRGRLTSRGYFNASYTYSRSYDDAGIANGPYPTGTNISQYWGPSQWDARNRFSLSWSYQIPGVSGGNGILGHVTNHWTFAGTTLLQSGTPYTVYTTAPFAPLRNTAGQIIGFAPGSGDFNADGDNFDFPNIASYTTNNSPQGYLNGSVTSADIAVPFLGTEGNEHVGWFRNPGFAEVDASLLRNFPLAERLTLQLRFEGFNILNRVNLQGVDPNMADGTFGKSTAQFQRRWFQFGARLFF